jgi:hypothetical protein
MNFVKIASRIAKTNLEDAIEALDEIAEGIGEADAKKHEELLKAAEKEDEELHKKMMKEVEDAKKKIQSLAKR